MSAPATPTPPDGPAPAQPEGGALHADAAHAARGGLVQLLSAAGQAMMPVYQILAARLFGVAAFGLYQATLAIVDVLKTAGVVGSLAGQHRFIAAHRAAGEEDLELSALGTGVRLVAGVSTVLAIALALFAPAVARAWQEPHLAPILPLIAPAVALSAITLVLIAATLGAKVARMSLYVRGIAEPACLLGACLLAWAAGGGVRRLIVAHVAAATVTAALAVAACARVFGPRRFLRALRAPRHPSFVRFVLPMAGADLLTVVLARADTFIITYFAGVDALAVYAAAEYVTRAIANPRYAFDPIAAPVLSEALRAGDGKRLGYNLSLMTRWVTLAAAPLAATIVALRREILGLYGPSFAAGASMMVILAGAHFVAGCLGLTSYVLSMSGRARVFLVNNFFAAAINIVIGVLLVPRIGPIGAAVAVLVGVTVYQVTLTFVTWVAERVHPFSLALGKAVVAALVAFAAEAAMRALPLHGGARIVAAIATGLAVYLVALLAMGPAEEERQLVARLFRRWRRPADPQGRQ